MRLVVLTWNLYHGRAIPPAGRDLLPDFAAALARWDWNLALLQEVPPWWPAELARAARAQQRRVLTSRNLLLPVRRALATRWPDLMRSGGGGCNAILARGAAITEERRLRLCRFPEGRWMHAVRLDSGIWVANLHATAHNPDRAAAETARAAATILSWAAGAGAAGAARPGGGRVVGAGAGGAAWPGGAPAILGGDFNLRHPQLVGLRHAGGHDVDHIFAAGMRAIGDAQTLDHGPLSDHAPLTVTLET